MGISGRVARYFLDSRLTPLIAVLVVVLGLFAVLATPREEEPQVDVTMANVLSRAHRQRTSRRSSLRRSSR